MVGANVNLGNMDRTCPSRWNACGSDCTATRSSSTCEALAEGKRLVGDTVEKTNSTSMQPPVPTITPREIQQWQQDGQAFSFWTSEIHEVTVSRLTVHIPMAFNRAGKPKFHGRIPSWCIAVRVPVRQRPSVAMTKYGFDNLYSLGAASPLVCCVPEEVG